MTPMVSVVMAVYNEELYLQQAIESILNQSLDDFEFVIVNDGSTDRSAEIIRSYNDSRIRLLNQENRGLTRSLNRGIKEARGGMIARMDADDISEPKRLEMQVEFLEANPDYVLVGTNVWIMTDDGEIIRKSNYPVNDEGVRQVLLHTDYSPFCHSSVMFRKDAAMKCGLYDERLATCQDWLG